MIMRFTQTRFFASIRTQFGNMTCSLLQEFIKLTDQSVTIRIRIRFLKKCISFGLIPPHLDVSKRYENCCLYQDSSKKHLRLLFLNHVKAVLRLELSDAYRQLLNIRNKVYKLYNRIINMLPSYITKVFFDLQEKNNGTQWVSEIARIDRKID